MSDYIPKIAYEISISINVGDFKTKDVNNFYIYRSPFNKTSSFATMNIPMDIDTFQAIDEKIKNNELPILNYSIRIASDNRADARSYKSKSGGISNTYRVLYVQSREIPKVESVSIPVTLYLANIVLYELTLTKSFNKVLTDSTAEKAISEYEKHINTTFGNNNSFSFYKKITNQTNHTYRQILIRSENDSLVPANIVNNYKPSSDLTYYFFDDFIPLSGFGILNGLLISLSKQNVLTFERWDITELNHQDLMIRTNLFKQESISDRGGLFKAENPTIFISDRQNRTKYIKGSSAPVSTIKKTKSSSDKIMDGRDVEHREVSLSETTKASRAFGINLYACDSVDMAEKRFNNIGNLIKNDIQNIETYESREIHYDALQFFRAYEMSPLVKERLYVPISIVNIFNKYNKHETTLNHSARTQFLVYILGNKK